MVLKQGSARTRGSEAMAWRFRTGAPWRDIPERFGKWNMVGELCVDALRSRPNPMPLRLFNTAYRVLAAASIVLGVGALLFAPLRAGLIGVILALVGMALWFSLVIVALVFWRARSFAPSLYGTALNKAMRRRMASLDARTKVAGLIILPFVVGFIVLDINAGKPAPYGVSAWGGYAFALVISFFVAVVAPVATHHDATSEGPTLNR
ncbi:transposase [Leifsonia sp. TF02-11]|uniref:transposase n=1 Tax=Leifsonia sp. TF02-11 TaxID=2815212 RepID=UPI001AA1585E|nr:transposase [Leifsonia sp. TF02-11]MBO1738233.1 transposase [Leifsonia sp. TF02-11]